MESKTDRARERDKEEELRNRFFSCAAESPSTTTLSSLSVSLLLV